MKKDIIHGFYTTGIIKFGDFKLKDNSHSPYYIDLRLLISHPHLLQMVCKELQNLITDKELQFDHIAGIPLAGVPIATIVSSGLNVSGLLLRKEPKEYGCNQMIEGKYSNGQKVLLIDDVITSAASKREAITILNKHLLDCTDIVVVVDRRKTDCDIGPNIYALITISEIIDTLLEYPMVRADDKDKLLTIKQFI